MVKNVDHELAIRLNAAMGQGRDSPDLWKEWTGKSIDELWADYVKWSVATGNVASLLLEYVVKNVDHELAIRLNAAMRQARQPGPVEGMDWKEH